MYRKPSQCKAGKSSKYGLFSFSILGLAFFASSALAQVPAVIVDAQQVLGNGYNTAESIAVSKNGTVYVADTLNNRVVALTPQAPGLGTNNVVTTGAVVLSSPQSLAIDANGNLFVGDAPSTGGRITELAGDGTGNLTGAATVLTSAGLLMDPISLAIDTTGTLFIGDYPATGPGLIYTLAPGGTPVLLPVAGLPSTFAPASLLRVANNLYVVDFGSGIRGSISGALYEVPSTGGVAQAVSTSSFILNTPSGLTIDAAGNLYLLTFLGNSTSYDQGEQIVVIPAASPSTPYLLPNTLNNSSSMAFDPAGNLDVLELGVNDVAQINFTTPVYLGAIPVGQNGTPIGFNIELNAPNTLNAGANGIFKYRTQGDVSNEIIQSGAGTCTTGKHTTLPNSGPTISATYPYTCQQAFAGSPEFPGTRNSSIEVKGAGSAILATAFVYDKGTGAAETSYPLNATATAIHLQVPQALAVSGLNNRVYVADFQAAAVYYTNGVAGANLTTVSTSPIALSAPAALAIDGAGNLFIGDYNLAEVIEVPRNAAVAPFIVNTGGLLTHPLAMTFDQAGNLYIGDAGPNGVFASYGIPGYVVKIPAGGAPVKMTIPSVEVIFPQALAIDPNTSALLIGDSGDPSGVGQVVRVSANASTAAVVPVSGVINPTGLTFDAAEDLYVLDGTANTITVVPPNGATPYPVLFNNALLIGASALVSSAGGQSFVVANVGGASDNSLVYLDGNRSSLAFMGVKVGTSSQSQTATEYNIGNSVLTFSSPYYSTNNTAAFSVLGSSTCGNNLTLNPGASCTFNFQFNPTFIGYTSQIITPQSNAYNPGAPSGAPEIILQGHGTSGGNIQKK